MSLGETIYRLRTEKNLSQGDLAEMLKVSRQSISKWENNSAVPDLEKIIPDPFPFASTGDVSELKEGLCSRSRLRGAVESRESGRGLIIQDPVVG